MKKRNIALFCFLFTAVLLLIGAVGNSLTSIPAMREHFSSEASLYWFNRMTAFMILGATGLYYGTLTTWIGVYYISRKEKAKQSTGKVLLLLSMLPQIPSIIALPLLTPSDWPHMITHIIAVLLISTGLFLYEK